MGVQVTEGEWFWALRCAGQHRQRAGEGLSVVGLSASRSKGRREGSEGVASGFSAARAGNVAKRGSWGPGEGVFAGRLVAWTYKEKRE